VSFAALRRAPGAALSLALAAATLATAAPAASAASTEAPRLKVLTYNTFLFSKTLYPNWGQDHRAKAIPAAPFFQGQDVVVLQETFDNSSSDALKANAAAQYPYQTPVVGRSKSGWDATGGSYSSTTPEDGGVTILSKWPIVRKEQYVYKDACGADWYSNKGFAYTVLNVNGMAGADARTGHPYSFDTELNSIASERYPDDPREDLDYVLYRSGNARPAGWTNHVVLEQSAPWTVSSWGKQYTYSNLSDHYPVTGF